LSLGPGALCLPYSYTTKHSIDWSGLAVCRRPSLTVSRVSSTPRAFPRALVLPSSGIPQASQRVPEAAKSPPLLSSTTGPTGNSCIKTICRPMTRLHRWLRRFSLRLVSKIPSLCLLDPFSNRSSPCSFGSTWLFAGRPLGAVSHFFFFCTCHPFCSTSTPHALAVLSTYIKS